MNLIESRFAAQAGGKTAILYWCAVVATVALCVVTPWLLLAGFLAVYFLFKDEQKRTASIAWWVLAILSIATLGALLGNADVAKWTASRAFAAGLAIAGTEFVKRAPRTGVRVASVAQPLRIAGIDGIALAVLGISVVLALLPFLRASLSGALFGDYSAIAAFRGLPEHLSAHLDALFVAVDSLVGAYLVYLGMRRKGASTVASGFAAVLWIIAGGRLAPAAMSLQPTLLIPLMFLVWKPLSRRSVPAGAALIAVCAFLAPQLAVAVAVLALADAFSERDDSRSRIAAVAGSIAGVALLMLTNIGIFPKLAMNVGPLAQPVLQFDGGDGTMPWEWLMPSSAAGISAALYQHTEIALWRFGNAWVLCESAGVIALAWFVYACFGVLRRSSSFRTFTTIAVVGSVYAALPSHVNDVPLPVPAALLHGAPAAFFGLSGILAIIVAAAMQFEAITTSRKSSLLSGALALCSVIGVMFTASPAGAMLWSPANSPLAAALGSVTEACQAPVAFAPGYEGDHPLQRMNRAIVASVAGAESKMQSIDFSAAANPPQKAQCMVIYYAQEGQYLPEPLNSFTNLPRSLQPPAVNVGTESNLSIAGWRIESLDNGIVTYRRDAGRPVTGRRQDTY